MRGLDELLSVWFSVEPKSIGPSYDTKYFGGVPLAYVVTVEDARPKYEEVFGYQDERTTIPSTNAPKSLGDIAVR